MKTRCSLGFGMATERHDHRIQNPDWETSECVRTYEPTYNECSGVFPRRARAGRARRRRQSAYEFALLAGGERLTAWPFLPVRAVQTRSWCDVTSASLAFQFLILSWHSGLSEPMCEL